VDDLLGALTGNRGDVRGYVPQGRGIEW
jgi:hypothetical protein